MQSHPTKKIHLGIIMDGNGRWATSRNLSRSQGHKAGLMVAEALIERMADFPVHTLTLFAFSSDNWKRPDREVSGLMRLLRAFLSRKVAPFIEKDVRVSFIGRRDRLPRGIVTAIQKVEAETSICSGSHLRIAVDYSARWEIVQAARRFAASGGLGEFAASLAPDTQHAALDLLIRTGGEKRLSDFMLWEAAYSEIWFSETPWPDFGTDELDEALTWFAGRDRRFGRAPLPTRERTVPGPGTRAPSWA